MHPLKLLVMPTEDDPRISRVHWLLAGGRGPPPTHTTFLRMALERKAAHREDSLRRAARREAYGQVKKAHTKVVKEHGTTGFTGLLKAKLGIEKIKEKPKRRELIDRFGGKEKSLRAARTATVADNAGHDAADNKPGGASGSAAVTPGDVDGEGKL